MTHRKVKILTTVNTVSPEGLKDYKLRTDEIKYTKKAKNGHLTLFNKWKWSKRQSS